MKKILSLIFMFLAVGPSFAGPLDILDAVGNFDGRFGRTSSYQNTNSEISFDMSQGVRFVGAPWIEPYIGFTKYQQLESTNTEWLAFGVKNRTFLAPFTFGFEYRDVVEPTDASPNNLLVGYISVYKDWNLKIKANDKD